MLILKLTAQGIKEIESVWPFILVSNVFSLISATSLKQYMSVVIWRSEKV